MEGAAILGVLLGFLVALGIWLTLGAIILRAAVAWYNKMAGTGPPQEPYATNGGFSPNVATPGAPPLRSDNPYAAPATAGGALPSVRGVPEPSFGYACAIVLVIGLAGLPVGFVLGLLAAAAGIEGPVVSLVGLPLQFLVGAAVLKGMLPTQRFGTACLIQLLYLVIVFLVVLAIGAIVALVGFGLMR